MAKTYFVKPVSYYIGGYAVCKKGAFDKDIVLYSGTEVSCKEKATILNRIRR